MRTIYTVLALSCLLVFAHAGTTSSSSSTKSSSSSAATSTGNSTTNSSSSGLSSGQCVAGSDAPCTAINADFCCMYSWYQYTGSDKVESYMCAMNPSKLGALSTLANDASSLASSITASSGYSSGSYCANSVFVRVSAVLASLGFLSLLF